MRRACPPNRTAGLCRKRILLIDCARIDYNP
ncbi:hypothetical protein OCH7691_00342 [Oceanibacterium hippocampi]|uniref:Uncharacterized protein n=1 Tax=Oceanibacterium hippocampi TaxID=745714 RepID=A0A1Y5RJL0_9PROT|nr:hypothetical protein OCH7691_00342 [Oceanibacterium hippocampi]